MSNTATWGIRGNLALARETYEAAMAQARALGNLRLVVNSLKRTEGVDVYDVETDLNPFTFVP